MKVPNNVVWQVVKKNNAYLVKRGRKGDQFTKDPLSVTNLHNASQNGIANSDSVSIVARKEAAKKGSRRVFDINIRHSGHHSTKKTSGGVYAQQTVKKEVNRLAKVVQSLKGVPESKKALLMKRVYKLHNGNKQHQKKTRQYKPATK
jgi:large subunit ribosomal protein L28e